MSNNKDDFWDLEKEIKKKSDASLTPRRSFRQPSTNAIEVTVMKNSNNSAEVFYDSALTNKANDNITIFVPPHEHVSAKKKYVIKEYSSQKPFIKTVRLISDKECDSVFVENNLFLRERRALIDRTATGNVPYTPYFSYSPRYSQLNRQQLSYYIWWRSQLRSGVYIPTDASYVILYAYEVAACGEGEDRQAALDSLCRVFAKCCGNDASLKMILRDIICDFSLIYDLTVSVDSFASVDRRFFFGSSFNIPEAFIDFSEQNILSICFAAAIYDYRRSKIYTEQTADIFKKAIGGALRAIFKDEKAFEFITSFKNGIYNVTTLEHKPLARMVNIINKNVRLEIEYYSLSTIQDLVTNAVRYSENRLREHLSIKSKLNILYLNPAVKDAIDSFFDANYPAPPVIDRRRREARQQEKTNEINEYDKLYDLPKNEFSPERALKIEEESWETTRKLEAAFGGDIIEQSTKIETVIEKAPMPDVSLNIAPDDNTGGSSIITDIASKVEHAEEFLRLCLSPSLTLQRKFASNIGKSIDELADLINEAALDIMSDILLEEDGDGYFIIDDYKDLFN